MSDWFHERGGLGGAVAVVVGGAGGLGEAITEDLVANGVRVAVLDLDAQAVAAIAARHPQAIVQHGDARDPEALAGLFEAVDERWDRLDILVNVVGGTFRSDFVDTNRRGWDALLRANLVTVLEACSLAIPRIRSGGRGGSIINLTTIEAHRAAPGFALYSAAKAAVTQFARTLAVELAPEGIRVNCVAPDFTPTPHLMQGADASSSPMGSPLGARVAIPMGRAGRTTDVSSCVVFLASRLSEYVTGSTLHPDGGALASSGWLNWPGYGWSNHAPPAVLADLPGRPDRP